MENVITNYADFFFKALEPALHRAVDGLNYTEAYEGFSDDNYFRCIMDGTTMGPHFRVLFSEEQDRTYMALDDDESENIFNAWDEAVARLSTVLSERPTPEGYSYYIDESDGCVYVSACESWEREGKF